MPILSIHGINLCILRCVSAMTRPLRGRALALAEAYEKAVKGMREALKA